MFCYNISPIVWNEIYNPSHVSDVLNISQITDLPLSHCCTWMAQILTSIWISLYSIQSSCKNVHGGSHVLHGTYLEPFCDPDWWWKKGHVRCKQSEVMSPYKTIFTWVDTIKGYVMWLMWLNGRLPYMKCTRHSGNTWDMKSLGNKIRFPLLSKFWLCFRFHQWDKNRNKRRIWFRFHFKDKI